MNTAWNCVRATLLACLATVVAAGNLLAHHGIGSVSGGSGGPIYTLAASTLAQGTWGYDVRFEHVDFDAFTDAELLAFDAAGTHADSTDFAAGTFVNVAYGVTDRLTVAVQLPYYHIDNVRHVHGLPPDVESEGDPSGLGDLSLWSFYQFWESWDNSAQATLVAALEVPTGRNDDLNVEDELFAADHQPASGSWDPTFGAALSKSYERLSLHGSLLYTFVNEGPRGDVLGDVLRYDAAAVYRLLGHRGGGHDHSEHSHAARGRGGPAILPVSYHPEHAHGASGAANEPDHFSDEGCDDCEGPGPWTFDLVLELNGIKSARDFLIDEGLLDSSGANVVFLSPGMRLTRCETWSTFVSAGYPIFQDQNEGEHNVQFRYTLGLSGSY